MMPRDRVHRLLQLVRYLVHWKRLGLVLHFLAGALLVTGMLLPRPPLPISRIWLSRPVLLALALGALGAGWIALLAAQQQGEMERGAAWLRQVLARLAQLRAPLNAETVRPLGMDLAAMFPQAAGWILFLKAPGGLVRGEQRRRLYLEVLSPAGESWDPAALESHMRGALEAETPPRFARFPDAGDRRREIWLCARRSEQDLGIALAVVIPRGQVQRRFAGKLVPFWDTAFAAVLDHLDLLEGHYLDRQKQLGDKGYGLRVRALVHELTRELQAALQLLAQPPAENAEDAETPDFPTLLSAYIARAAHWVALFREIPFGETVIPVTRRPVALAEVAADTLRQAKLAWPGVYFHWQGRRDVAVLADDHLVSVLRNVFFNAASFCPKGEVRLHVTRAAREVRLWVEDGGPGLTRDQAETIFGEGEKPETPGRPRGMGVGLTIAREITREYGGDLVCHPKEEGYGGGCFEIRLPYAGERILEETK